MLQRTRLVDQAIDDLSSRLESGEWRVGTAIPPEPDLAAMLGIGRSTVREAVRALSHTGLLEVRQGHGTFVRASVPTDMGLSRRADLADVREVTEVRRGLEIEAARLAARRRRPEDVRRLRASLERRAGARPGALDGFIKADIDFHQAVVAATHNRLLADLYRAFTTRLGAALTATQTERDLRHDSDDSHVQLVEAIVARDEAGAARAAAAYLDPLTRTLDHLPEAAP